jgi:hypothetical protein
MILVHSIKTLTIYVGIHSFLLIHHHHHHRRRRRRHRHRRRRRRPLRVRLLGLFRYQNLFF